MNASRRIAFSISNYSTMISDAVRAVFRAAPMLLLAILVCAAPLQATTSRLAH